MWHVAILLHKLTRVLFNFVVLCAFVCGIYTNMCGYVLCMGLDAHRKGWLSCPMTLSYSIEKQSLIEPKDRLGSQQAAMIPLTLPSTGLLKLQASSAKCFFRLMLRMCPQAFVIRQQALLSRKASSGRELPSYF